MIVFVLSLCGCMYKPNIIKVDVPGGTDTVTTSITTNNPVVVDAQATAEGLPLK
jgi:hypothetical protein